VVTGSMRGGMAGPRGERKRAASQAERQTPLRRSSSSRLRRASAWSGSSSSTARSAASAAGQSCPSWSRAWLKITRGHKPCGARGGGGWRPLQHPPRRGDPRGGRGARGAQPAPPPPRLPPHPGAAPPHPPPPPPAEQPLGQSRGGGEKVGGLRQRRPPLRLGL